MTYPSYQDRCLLHRAVIRGTDEEVRKWYAIVGDARQSGRCVIERAFRNGPARVRLLLELGANIDGTDDNGNTVVHMASGEMLERALELGASTMVVNKRDQVPTQTAATEADRRMILWYMPGGIMERTRAAVLEAVDGHMCRDLSRLVASMISRRGL